MRTGARNIVDADIQARRGGASGVRPMTVAPTNFDRGGGRLRAYGPLIFFGAGVVVGSRAWAADAFQEGRPITQTHNSPMYEPHAEDVSRDTTQVGEEEKQAADVAS